MLLWLAHYLQHYLKIFSLFHYLSFRSILSALTALSIALFAGPWVIRKLTAYKVGQTVRDYIPENHLKKSGTPTMGGILILLAITFSTLLWSDLSNQYVWLVLLVTVGFGIIGGVDDYRKLKWKNHTGLPARWKYFWQSVIAIIAAVYIYLVSDPTSTSLVIPFLKNVVIHLGPALIILAYFVIVGASNAVNLTDGLDGLAVLPAVMVIGSLGVFAYLTGNAEFAPYLFIPYVPGAGELAVVCAALVGAGLGFLWFNTYPARVFMGDTGSLCLGAAMGVVAIVVKQELVLFIMGGIFVIETLSVIFQVFSFKLTGKRIFLMAPLHHHFELKGWPEPRVIVRFWIVTFILVLLGLATLKLR